MNIAEASIRRPVMTTLVMGALIVFGVFAYRVLPVSELPNVEFPTIEVRASLPGANPETMASSVAQPLESQFSRISGIRAMSSISAEGLTRISIEFDLDRDIDSAALDVQSAMATAARELPPGMSEPPSFRKRNPADFAIFYMGLSSSTQPITVVDDYADTLIAQKLSTINGVAQVMIWGQQKYAVRIQVDPGALATRGIGLDEVERAVRAANTNQPTGSFSGPHQTTAIKTTGQLHNAAGFNSLIVAYRNGAPVRLSEIGRAIDNVQFNKVSTWYGERQGVMIAVYRQPGSNTVHIVDEIRKLLPSLRQQLPASIDLEVMYDRAQSIKHSVVDVQFTLMLAAALVVLVIFLFLRNVAATVIASIALPISVVGTFSAMYMMGFSLNNLSLMALTLSVGFVVDDAIVMLENIMRHREKGLGVMEAALKGSREIGFTIISMTISLVAVFIPVIFLGGMVGRLLHEFAVTISATILVSGLVSLTLTPLMCSRFIRSVGADAEAHGRIYRWSERIFEGMLRAYDRSLVWCLDHRHYVMLVFVATLGCTWYLYSVIQKDFLPPEDTGRLIVYSEGGQDISYEAMLGYQKQIAAIAAADPNIEAVMSRAGAAGSRLTTNAGLMLLRVKPRAERPEPNISKVVQRLRKSLNTVPGVKAFVRNPPLIRVGGRLSNSEYQYTMQDIDLDLLYRWAGILSEEFARLPGFQGVSNDLNIATPTLLVNIDRDKAGTMGIDAQTIESVLAAALGAKRVSTIYTSSNQYAVILEVAPEYQRDPASLKKLYVRSSTGRLVPIDALTTATREVSSLTINHQGQLPAVTISFNLAPDMSLGTAIDSIRQLERQLQMPATITTTFQGTARVFEESLAGMGLLLFMAILVVYIVLGILYESFVHPLTILSGLPAAGVGALLTLIVFGMPLTLYAFVGIIMLVGIVKKNAIMMIDFALVAQREQKMEPAEAIYQACLIRFRPIMMTTMAALMGSLPIAIGFGQGGEARAPLGLTVVGGLLLSQVITLYLTPVVYLYLEKLRSLGHRAAARRRAEKKPARAAAE